MILSLRIAFKLHRGIKNNALISLVSVISILGIIVGITMSIVTLSTINGFKYELGHRILAVIPHGEIRPAEGVCIDWKVILPRIKGIKDIIYANPYINFSGIIECNYKWHLVSIRSVYIDQNFCATSDLYDFVDKNSWNFFCKKTKQIILGKGLADFLGVTIGDWVSIAIDNNFFSQDNRYLCKKIFLQVAGVLNLQSQLDCNLAVISFLEAESYCNELFNIIGVEIKVNNIFTVNSVVQKIRKVLKEKVYIYSWIDNYGYIYKDIYMVYIIIYIIMILIVGISVFNVIATLILSIKHKQHDIAIFSALGAKAFFIESVFFWYGLLIYIISSILGSVLSILLSLNLNNLVIFIEKFLNKKIFLSKIYFIDFLPSKLDIWDILLILVLTLLFGITTSYYTVSKTIKSINLCQILK
ncbi:FtsX-like permease family protein [Candidatus Blochmannia ocreatus (nom. nud.)]|uniref:Lipoprotein-releasing system transmembrane subunit LolE n=1 Tax=Candidatus Blochmannia ocreatus (nom. nud.) TaxID=251538 RepID=A0ABY4SSE7_9ENTR|nr:FtsX-like permease family protein [Candidatus Blochmannia ocreatus]URJ24899.1 lipoprotein-releasing system transmembrane subunit LolE [Candidatus Blochmannia ocreatus]